MPNKKFLIFLSLALVMSLLSAGFIVSTVRSLTPVVRYDDPVKVVVAAKDIQAFSVITPDALAVKEIPGSIAPAGAVTSVSAVLDKTSRGLLLAGDIIRHGHLTETEAVDNQTTAALSALNDPYARAVMVPLPEGLVFKKGDRVNIIHLPEAGASAGTVLQDVLVLSADAGKAFLVLSQQEAEQLAGMLFAGHIVYTLSPVQAGR